MDEQTVFLYYCVYVVFACVCLEQKQHTNIQHTNNNKEIQSETHKGNRKAATEDWPKLALYE